MKIKAAILSGILFVSASLPAFAQFSDIDTFLGAGAEDAETLTRAYLNPLPSGLGANINSGWVNSAKTHKLLGFDLQIRGALSFVPKSDQSFDLNDLDLKKIQPANNSNTVSPTASGIDEIGPEVVIKNNGNEVARFNLPSGSGYSIIPAPMIQAGLGLVKHTDLIARFIPKVSYDGKDFKMIGFGLKHGINQWLPGGSLLPVDISILGGFTNIDINSSLELEPNGVRNPKDPTLTSNPNPNFDNQNVHASINTFTIKALVGKDLPFISLYGGVGYETSTMNIDLQGDYPVNVSTNTGDYYNVIEDPFSYEDQGQNKFSLLGGVTLKLAFFHLFGEYTLAKYPAVNAGFGFSFR